VNYGNTDRLLRQYLDRRVVVSDVNNDNPELAAIVSDTQDTLSVDSYSNLHTLVADILGKICGTSLSYRIITDLFI